MGPLSLEYTGAAIPAVARTDCDQLKSELRLAYPLKGDNELEFGARYRWDITPTPTPWVDRAQLFLGVKLRIKTFTTESLRARTITVRSAGGGGPSLPP